MNITLYILNKGTQAIKASWLKSFWWHYHIFSYIFCSCDLFIECILFSDNHKIHLLNAITAFSIFTLVTVKILLLLTKIGFWFSVLSTLARKFQTRWLVFVRIIQRESLTCTYISTEDFWNQRKHFFPLQLFPIWLG